MPQRLAQALCDEAGMPADRKAGELRKEERVRLLAMLTQASDKGAAWCKHGKAARGATA